MELFIWIKMDLALIYKGWYVINPKQTNWTFAKLKWFKYDCFDIYTAYLCLTEFFEVELFLTLKLCTYANPNCL